MLKNHTQDHKLLEKQVTNFVNQVEQELDIIIQKRTNDVSFGIKKVLDAFYKYKVGSYHFSSVNGYGHNDLGRDLVDKIFAEVLGADKAAVRMQIVSGTHAITSSLFGAVSYTHLTLPTICSV